MRIGSAVVQAKNWRMAAFGGLGLAALALGGLIYEANNTNIATYVVPIDPYARPGRIELAGRTYEPTTAEIGYFLADWVRRTRSKSIDPIVIRDNWTGPITSCRGRRSGSSTTSPRPTTRSPTRARRRSTSRSCQCCRAARTPTRCNGARRSSTPGRRRRRKTGRACSRPRWAAEERGRAEGQPARHLHHRVPMEP